MNICLDCRHNLYPGSRAVAEDGYVGCDWGLKVESSDQCPDGLLTESGTVAEGWVRMNRYRLGEATGRLVNYQLLIKDATHCGRYSKE